MRCLLRSTVLKRVQLRVIKQAFGELKHTFCTSLRTVDHKRQFQILFYIITKTLILKNRVFIILLVVLDINTITS